MPGFVNAHTHLEYANYAGFGDGRPFGPWIRTHIARKAQLDARDMLAVARLGALESLRAGRRDHRRLQLLRGGRARRGGRRAAGDGLPRGVRRRPGRRGAAVAREARTRRGVAARPDRHLAARAVHLLARHVPLLPLARRAGRDAPRRERERDRVAPPRHAGRSRRSRRSSSRRPGQRPVAALEPVLGPELLCAHCVEVDDSEIALLAARDVPVAHCPRSNALLGCGVAPLTALRTAGVRVGLGTDSPASTPSFDLFEELRAAVYAARARERRADALGATEALALATIDSARALRLDAEVGTLTARKARRSDGRVARREPVPSGRGSGCGGRVRRLSGPSARDDRRRTDPLPEGRRDTVARGTQHRKRRTGPNARKPATAPSVAATRKQRPPEWQEQLFFQRLRVHAKWAFVLLALVFGLGFVFLGIGSGSNGITDALQNASTSASRAAARRSRSSSARRRRTRSTPRRGATSQPPTRRSSARTTRSSRWRSTQAYAPRTATRSPSSPPSTASRRTSTRPTTRTACRPPPS